MAKENRKQAERKFTAPVGKLLIQAYREEAVLFDREGKETRAKQYRRAADRMEMSSRQHQPE